METNLNNVQGVIKGVNVYLYISYHRSENIWRYQMLQGGTLFYFTNPLAAQPRGIIPIEMAVIGKSMKANGVLERRDKYLISIQIHPSFDSKKQTYFLSARTRKSQADWLEVCFKEEEETSKRSKHRACQRAGIEDRPARFHNSPPGLWFWSRMHKLQFSWTLWLQEFYSESVGLTIWRLNKRCLNSLIPHARYALEMHMYMFPR